MDKKLGYGFIVILLLLGPIGQVQGIIPESYTFYDSDKDSVYFNFTGDNEDTKTNNVDFGAAELISVSYSLDRQDQKLQVQVTTEDNPIVNSSAYYSMTIELENSTSKVSIRVYYGSLGGLTLEDPATYSIFYQGDFIETDNHDTTIQTEAKSILWQVSTNIVDIVRIFDDPNMLLSRVSAELEYSVNGSSSMGRGEYYRDEFKQEEFDFSGGVQGIDTDEDFWDMVDPFALVLYFGIPVLFIIIRIVKRVLLT